MTTTVHKFCVEVKKSIKKRMRNSFNNRKVSIREIAIPICVLRPFSLSLRIENVERWEIVERREKKLYEKEAEKN